VAEATEAAWTASYAARMTPAPWWQTAVIYQIYPRSFQDTTGNGVGDLPGITARLPYLAETLGVDAIWISPFYPSPMADFGYDVSDYRDVEPLFGTLDDFDDLVAEAHRQGIRVIIDWVPNHTSDRHPWFVASRSSRADPKRDWYVWRDPAPGGGPPNNWLSVFGGSAWEWDEATGQYYLHSFLAEQPDLDWRNPEVEAEMLDTLRFWLDRGVDGFRMDVIHFILKDPEFRDNPVLPGDDRVWAYTGQEHLYDKLHPDIHPLFRRIRAVLDAYPGDRVAIGEVEVAPWPDWVRYYGEALDGLHMPFNFQLIFLPWDAAEVRAMVDAYEAALPEGAWPNYVLGNHDQRRIATRVGRGQARVAAMLLFTLRGTPTTYYGDEIGMVDVEIPPDAQQDPFGRSTPGLGRDGCRTPMQWDHAATAGFTPAGEGWLPLNPDHETRNVAAQLGRDGSMLDLYRSLLRLRRAHRALQLGTYRAIERVPDGVYAYRREDGEERFLVILGFTGAATEVEIEETGTVVASTLPDAPDRFTGRYRLRGDEGIVIRLD